MRQSRSRTEAMRKVRIFPSRSLMETYSPGTKRWRSNLKPGSSSSVVSSVVLLEVDRRGLAVRELEGDAPRPVHVHRVARRGEALQGMKVEARYIECLQVSRRVQSIEPPQDPGMQSLVDS